MKGWIEVMRVLSGVTLARVIPTPASADMSEFRDSLAPFLSATVGNMRRRLNQDLPDLMTQPAQWFNTWDEVGQALCRRKPARLRCAAGAPPMRPKHCPRPCPPLAAAVAPSGVGWVGLLGTTGDRPRPDQVHPRPDRQRRGVADGNVRCDLVPDRPEQRR